MADTDDLRRYPAERPIAPQDSPKMADDNDNVMNDPLDMLREWWGYEGDDVAEGIRAVEKYCRTMERRLAERPEPEGDAFPGGKNWGTPMSRYGQ